VSKRRDSTYKAGPSRHWIKVKNPNETQRGPLMRFDGSRLANQRVSVAGLAPNKLCGV
jgi:ATP-dependent DNA ligase